MFKKSGKICVAALAVLTLNAGNQAFASCSDSINSYINEGVYHAEYSKKGFNQKALGSGALLLTTGAYPIVTGAGVAGVPFIGLGITASLAGGNYEVLEKNAKANISTTMRAFGEDEKELTQAEAYAYSVLGSSSTSFNNIDPTVASFIKNVKREISNDRNAIIPTDDEIIRAIETVNHDLSACSDEDGEFFMPEKSGLVKTVIDYLNY